MRLELERFRFPLIKRKAKQKIFQILLKEKNGGRKKLKKCIEKISVSVRRSGAEASGNAPIELPRSTSVKLSSEPPRARRVISRGSVQKKLEFQPKGTAVFTRSEKTAEEEGFEPSKGVNPYPISNRALSTSQPLFQFLYLTLFFARYQKYDILLDVENTPLASPNTLSAW